MSRAAFQFDILMTVIESVFLWILLWDREKFDRDRKRWIKFSLLFLFFFVILIEIATYCNWSLFQKSLLLLLIMGIYGKILYKYTIRHIFFLNVVFSIILGFSENLSLVMINIIFRTGISFDDFNETYFIATLLLSHFIDMVVLILLNKVYNFRMRDIDLKSWLILIIPISVNEQVISMAEKYLHDIVPGTRLYWTIFLFATLFAISSFCCIVLVDYMMNGKAIEREAKMTLNQIQIQYDYYRDQLDDSENVKKAYHDIKNHLLVLEGMKLSQDKKDYIDQIDKEIRDYASYFDTGNEFLDVLLHHKAKRANRDNIRFDVAASLRGVYGISDKDLCTIFSNTIDNAIEECLRIEQADSRVIQLRAQCVRDIFSFTIINKTNFKQDSVKDISDLRSKKVEEGFHGYGLKSIQGILDKHNGDMSIEISEGMFRVYILIPLKGRML